MPNELERAFRLMCEENWVEAVRELESLKGESWKDKTSPSVFTALVLNMKAEAHVKLHEMDLALAELVAAYDVDPGGTSIYLSKIALEQDLAEYYEMAAAGLRHLLGEKTSGEVADTLAGELEEVLAQLEGRLAAKR